MTIRQLKPAFEKKSFCRGRGFKPGSSWRPRAPWKKGATSSVTSDTMSAARSKALPMSFSRYGRSVYMDEKQRVDQAAGLPEGSSTCRPTGECTLHQKSFASTALFFPETSDRLPRLLIRHW